MKVIGAIGLNGSGKDEIVNHLNSKYGIPLISVGDIVREIAAKDNIEPTRDNLDNITKRYFKQYGDGYFLKLVVEKIKLNKWQVAGISGIRSPSDIKIMRDAFGEDFVLVNVSVTHPQIRYERTLKRGSKRDLQSYEDFLRQDKTSEELFHIRETIELADYSLNNDGTLDDLHNQLDTLIKEYNLLEK
jgi:dephospho-CoA kinase